jgi:hypothetical protein
MLRPALLSLPLLSLLVACAAPQKPAVEVASSPAPQAAEPAPESAAEPVAVRAAISDPAPAPIPTECATTDKGLCLPDAEYAQKLCAGFYPEVALAMFGKDTPWTRMYLSGNTESWNASGGHAARTKLAFDEEVIVLTRRAPRTGGIVMTGVGDTFDVLRWDGSCVSLEAGEMTARKPPQAKRAPIAWPRLAETTKTALRAAPKVAASLDRLSKDCEGDAAKTKCAKAEIALTNAIADHVRAGAALPLPARRP